MNTTVDTRVVEMKFDNKNFETNVSQTMRTCEKLKNSLNFKGTSKGLDELSKATKNVRFDGMTKGIDTVKMKFSALQVVAATALSRITNSVITAGKKFASAFTIEPIKDGLAEYNLKMNSIMTIMNSSGKSLKTVSKYLDELNTYADQTKYSFSDMTSSIGKFTNAGVGLKDSVEAIKGVANLAAYSGSTSAQANSAMYNFSQSLSSGFLNLLDYKSIELAGMGTKRFRQELIDTAVEFGTLKKVGKDAYESLTTNNKGNTSDVFGVNQVRDNLQYKWATNDVLVKTLQKFTDTTTKLGREATRAATQFKTFGEMFDALKEEAGSGWATTFELIFGNFNQARKLWTEVGSFGQNVINNMSQQRNDMLREWQKLGGRDDLIVGFKNAAQGLISVLKPIKAGFRDIFPPMTGQRLAEITKNFKDFTSNLKVTKKQANDIQRTFRGLFAALDIIAKITGGAFQLGLSVVSKVISKLGGNALDLTGNIGDLIVKFHDWLTTNSFIAKGIGKVVDIVSDGIVAVIGWINAFGGLPAVQSFISNFDDNAKKVFGNFKDYMSGGIDAFAAFIDRVKSIDHLDMDTLVDIAKDFKENVLGYFIDFDIKGIVKPITDGLKKIKESFSDTSNAVTKKTGTVYSAINNLPPVKLLNLLVDGLVAAGKRIKADNVFTVLEGIIDTFRKHIVIGQTDLGKLILEALGIVALFKIGGKIGQVAETLSRFVNGITGVITGLSKVLDGVVGVLKAYQMDLKAEALLKIAGAIAILVGAIVVLTRLDPSAMWESIKALGALAAGLALFSVVVNKFGGGTKTAISVVGISSSLLIIVKSLKTMQELDPIRLEEDIKTLVKVMVTFTALAVIASRAGAQMNSSAMYFVGLGVGVRMIAKSLRVVDELEDPQGSVRVLLLLMTGLRALTSASKLGLGQSSGMGKDIILMAASLLILVKAIKKITSIDMNEVSDNAGAFILVFGTLGGMIAACRILSTGKGIIDKAGVTILAMSASLILVATAMKIISKIDNEGLGHAAAVVSGLLVLYGGLVAISKFSGENAAKAGVMILSMSGALMLISGAIILLSNINGKDLKKATASIVAVEGMFAVLIGVSHFSKDATGTFKMMAVSIGILTAALVTLSFIDEAGVKKATIAMTTVMGAFAGLVASTALAKNCTVTIGLLAGIVAELGIVIALLANLPIENTIASAGALSMLLLAMSGSMLMISKMGGVLNKGTLGTMVVLTGVVSALAVVISLVSTCTNAETAVGVAGALSLLLTALSGACLILSTMSGFAGGAVATAAILTVIVGALGVVIGALAQYTNAETAIGVAAALSLMLISLSAACVILNAGSFNPGALATAGVLTGIIAILALVIKGLAEVTDAEKAIKIAQGLSVLLLALSAACAILTVVGLGGPAALIGVQALVALIVEVGGLMVAIGALVDKVPQAETFLKKGMPILESIGTAIGKFAGNLVGGFMEGVASGLPKVAKQLSQFMENLAPFFAGASSIPANVSKNLGDLAKAILIITAAKVLDAATSWLTGGNSMIDFAKQLKPFAEAFVEYAQIIQNGGVDAKVIKASSAAAESIATFASKIPNQGGFLADLVGDNTLSQFATELSNFAEPFVKFCKTIQKGKINEETVQTAMKAAESITAFAKGIPNQGGMLAEWVGDNTLTQFGTELSNFAEPFVKYCHKIMKAKINEETVTSSSKAAESISTMASKLSTSGGFISSILGQKKSLTDFAKELDSFGTPFVNYCNKIMSAKINEETVTSSSKAAEAIAAFANKLGKGDNVFSVLSGKKVTMSEFGKNLETFGSYFAKYYNHIKGVKQDVVDSSTSAAKALATVAKTISKLPSGWGSNDLSDFGDQLADFGKGFKKFYNNLGSMDTSKLTSVVSNISNLTRSLSGFTQGDASAAKKLGSAMSTLGKNGINDLMKSFNGADQKLVNVVSGMMTAAANEIANRRGDFEKNGQYIVAGLITGMKSKLSDVRKTATQIAETVEKATRKKLEINSPSRVMKKLYTFAAAGAVSGLTEGKKKVAKASEDVANAAVNTTSNTLNKNGKKVKKSGESVPNDLKTGIDSGKKNATKSAKSLGTDTANAVKESVSKADYKEIGKTMADGLSKSLNSKAIIKLGKETVKNIQKGLKSGKSIFKDYAESTDESGKKIKYTLKNAADAFLKFKDTVNGGLQSCSGSLEQFTYKTDVSYKSMLNGLKSNTAAVTKWKENFTRLVASGASKSVIKYFAEGGMSLATELDKLVEQGNKGIKKFCKEYQKNLKAVKNATNTAVTSAMKKTNTWATMGDLLGGSKLAVKSWSKVLDKYSDKLKDFKENLESNFKDITKFFSKITESTDTTLMTMFEGMQSHRYAESKFMVNIAKLQKLGLDKDLLSKFIEGGYEQYGAEVAAIANAGASGVAKMNAEIAKTNELNKEYIELLEMEKLLNDPNTKLTKKQRKALEKEIAARRKVLEFELKAQEAQTKITENELKENNRIATQVQDAMFRIENSSASLMDKNKQSLNVLEHFMRVLEQRKKALLAQGYTENDQIMQDIKAMEEEWKGLIASKQIAIEFDTDTFDKQITDVKNKYKEVYAIGEEFVQKFLKSYDGVVKDTAILSTALQSFAERMYKNSDQYKEDREQLAKYNKELRQNQEVLQSYADRRQALLKELYKLTSEDESPENNAKIAWLEDEIKKLTDEMTNLEKETKTLQDTIDEFDDSTGTMAQHMMELYNTLTGSVTSSIKTFIDPLKASFQTGISLFEEFKSESETTADSILENMKSQVDGIKEWRQNLETLSKRGISADLLAELEAMGVSGADKVAAFMEMTDAELAEANGYFAESVAQSNDMLLNNMKKSQNEAVEWSEKLGKLAGAGWSEAVLVAIAEQGIDSMDLINQLLAMTPEQKAEYEQAYQTSMKLPETITNDIIASFALTGQNGAASYAQGFTDATPEATNNIADATNAAIANAGESNSEAAYNAGYQTGESYNDGVTAAAANSTTAVGANIVNEILKYLDPQKANEIGSNFVSGLQNGFLTAENAFVNKVNECMNAAIEQICNAFSQNKNKFMSSVKDLMDAGLYQISQTRGSFYQLGYYLAQGLIDGLVDGFNSPVITPVLDLSKVSDDFYSLNAMLSREQAVIVGNSLDANANSNKNNQNDSDDSNSGDVYYEFTQNNYSPTALSRADIYRQTKNQFAMVKEAIST